MWFCTAKHKEVFLVKVFNILNNRNLKNVYYGKVGYKQSVCISFIYVEI